VVVLGLLRRRFAPQRSADVRHRPARLLRLRRWGRRRPARVASLRWRRPAALRTTRLRAAVTPSITPVAAWISTSVPPVPAVVTPTARRRTAIPGAIVPIAGTGAAIVSAAPAAPAANDHARLNNRGAITVTIAIAGLVTCGDARVGWISGIAAAGGVSGGAVWIHGATGYEGGRSEDQRCNCEFHMSEKAFINGLRYLTVSRSGCRKKFVKFYLRRNRVKAAGIANGTLPTANFS
jgi:hypothetical protein